VPQRPHLPLLPLLICGAVVIAGFLALSIARNAVRNYQLHGEERALRTELRQLDADREQLSSVRDYLASDEYIEDVARRVLGLVRPGETLVIVSGTDAVAAPTPQRTPGAAWWRELFVAPPATPTPSIPQATD
jgi:cell division protein FtsB